jgi:hypothetical protein
MKLYLKVTLIILFVISACAARNKPGEMAPDADPNNLPDLIGTYIVNGVDPLGDEYGGHLTITAGNEPGTYHLQWIVTGGIQEGIGYLKGNQLMVEWESVEGVASASGTVSFTVTETGQLYGTRTSESLDGQGQEQAYPNQ